MAYIGNSPDTSYIINTKEYVATEGQTVFNGVYTEGVSVYINGLLLSTTDYVATDGASIVLNVGASAGDIVKIHGYTDIATVSGVVTSVASKTGDVVLTEDDITDLDKYTKSEVDTAISGLSSELDGAKTRLGEIIKDEVVASDKGWSSAKIQAELEDKGNILNISYEKRGDLRSLPSKDGSLAVIDSLGLFVFEVGSTEPDDDESSFAASTGVWLLQAAHWDIVDTWQMIDDAVRDEYDEDETLRFDAFILRGTAKCTITSINATNSASFEGSVLGAVTGDTVIATPPTQLGSTPEFSARLSYHAFVSANDTVTVRLTNASASSATTNIGIQTDWKITVIKEKGI